MYLVRINCFNERIPGGLAFRRAAIFIMLYLLLSGCASHLSDLPPTSQAAFAIDDHPRQDRLLMESLIVQGTIDDALKAAEEAFASVGFDARPESWTTERRCAEYMTSLHEWPFWGYIYFEAKPDNSLRCRIIVKSWTSFGFTTSQPWHLHLSTAFQNRLRAIQESRR